MTFRVLVVEDSDPYYGRLEEAVHASNDRSGRSVPVRLLRAATPDAIEDRLAEEPIDALLSDVYFRALDGIERDRLGDVVDKMDAWQQTVDGPIDTPESWRIPLIAISGRGPDALKACMRFEHRLYDIWDKLSTDEPMVAWRLTRLSRELRRLRAGAVLQRGVMQLSSGPRWRDHVGKMIRAYNRGWNERDQAARTRDAIKDIATDVKWPDAETLLRVGDRWEQFSHALSLRARGHTRHVVHVFWLGYVLINSDTLAGFWQQSWVAHVSKRAELTALKMMEWVETINDGWFVASLFHDTAGCVEKVGDVVKELGSLVTAMDQCKAVRVKETSVAKDQLREAGVKMSVRLGGDIEKVVMKAFVASVEEHRPDHGVMAALFAEGVDGGTRLKAIAGASARAMAVHNVVGDAGQKDGFWGHTKLSWREEPLACLLVLCDQLQSWARERSDIALPDEIDGPQRSELMELSVLPLLGHVQVKVRVDYLLPRYVELSMSHRERERTKLKDVLRDRVFPALGALDDWPFDIEVTFTLNDEETLIAFRREAGSS